MLAGRVAVRERDVLHRQLEIRLVLTVRCGPHLTLVTRVDVQDPAEAGPAQRHLTAAVDDYPGAGVADLGRGTHDDSHRKRAAAEGDDAALGHRSHHCGRGAAGRTAVADHVIRITTDAPHPAIRNLEMHAAVPRSRMAPHVSPAVTPRRFISDHPLRA